MHEVIARSDFWHNATELFVFSDLRGDFARYEMPIAQNGDSSFIARRFKSENGHDTNPNPYCSSREALRIALRTRSRIVEFA
jgi:hypothetical protein